MGSWISRAKSKMAEKRLTQTDIAPSMGKNTRGAIGHYFTGRSKPTLDQLEGLAKFLGVSLSWLVSDHGENTAVDDETLEECLMTMNRELSRHAIKVGHVTRFGQRLVTTLCTRH